MNLPTAPYAGMSPLTVPVASNPPVLADVTNIVQHCRRVAKRKRDDPTSVSDNELAAVVLEKHRV